jgi:dihydrofolate reductase
MARLRYLAIASLDGFIADEHGRFEWAAPDEEMHGYVNDRMRDVGTYLYGRRMYETMLYWETAETGSAASAVERDFTRIWRAADKIVYSTTLRRIGSARTHLEAAFDPEEVRRLKARADTDLAVGGPHLAAHALRAGLVDELELLVVPAMVGGGTAWLPTGLRLDLELESERRFRHGAIALRYRVRH